MRELDYFSRNYQVARKKFLAAAFTAGASVDSVKNPHPGPDNQPLFMDVALIGDTNAERTLVLSSGTHGVEGFAGSGIQTGLLSEGIGSRLPKGVNLLMIHGINPFGMAHLRRSTEDNVDLNRNFRDHDKPYPENAQYEDLADVLAPRSLSFWSEVILNVPDDLPEYQRALGIWGSSFVKTTFTGESVSAHLDASLKLAIPQMLPKAEVTSVGLEFGTVPPMQIFKALRGENWLHHHGGQEHPSARQLKICLLRAFHPNSEEWEASVWRQGVQVVERALTSLAH